MAWDHLAVTKPHLVYIILGGFTSLFMLCSSFIKERLYIGEATVATICGIIFGPHAANLIDPLSWGTTDLITLEFSRIVLVVQCFAVGVELPKYYMERHWRSVVFLLIPVMTFGWLLTSLFVFWMMPRLSWLESLCVAACVTATDPVLASSVVGKGKFAKRIPKHLRDILSAESGCNDGMAFPFVYLAIYCIQDHLSAKEVTKHWFLYTILYECVFGAIYGFLIGYIGRHGIKYAERRDLVDRESFLVFYFVLALFCAGSGSILGVDDLLVGFAAGVGFSNDGWFTQKTEESHVSNVIDLLINLAYFVYLGTIIPWAQYNDASIGTTPWRLVVIALFVIFFRRIPIMLALKPFIPDIKTWREAMFAGHFGPIGVGAIFVAILARAELEAGHTIPENDYPTTGAPNATVVALIWPITTFLVITSIIVHGSSIAVFTLGKHINTLTITMSYTTAREEGPGWMNRLPRIQSTSRSMARTQDSDMGGAEKMEYPPGTLPSIGYPGTFLRRQRDDDDPSRTTSRTSSLMPLRRKKQWNEGMGPGGPISQSAIYPQRRQEASQLSEQPSNSSQDEATHDSNKEDKESTSDDSTKNESPLGNIQHDPEMERIVHETDEQPDAQHGSNAERRPNERNLYDEGSDIVIENADGEVLTTQRTPAGKAHDDKVKAIQQEMSKGNFQHLKKKLGTWRMAHDTEGHRSAKGKGKDVHKSGPALAYQFGNTIIVEDADGEVVKTWEVPHAEKQHDPNKTPRQGLAHMMTWSHWSPKSPQVKEGAPSGDVPPEPSTPRPAPPHSALSRVGTGLLRRTTTGFGFGAKAEANEDSGDDDEDDRRIRVTIGSGGQRLTKEDFIKQIQGLDPKARASVVEASDVPEHIKEMARRDAKAASKKETTPGHDEAVPSASHTQNSAEIPQVTPRSRSPVGGTPEPSKTRHTKEGRKTAVEESFEREMAANSRREYEAVRGRKPSIVEEDEEDEKHAMEENGDRPAAARFSREDRTEEPESKAEKRRREAALGVGSLDAEDSDDDDTERVPPTSKHGLGVLIGGNSAELRSHEQEAERDGATTTGKASAVATSSGGSPKGIRFAAEPVGRKKEG